MDEVASLLLSPFFQVFFERMASGEFLDIFRGRKVIEGLLHKLKISLLSMSALCEDAEEIQLTNPAVKEWLNELKDVVYDAEDIFDEIATELLQRKLDAEFQTTASKVRNSICTSLSPFVKEVEPKIKEVLDKLEYLARQKDALGLKEGVGRESSKRLPTTSLVEESDIFGRNDDTEKIINLLLLDDACGNENLYVISIVGMGGIGKTTLAQLVYKDKRVKEHFNLQAWVCVSDEFDVFKVTKTILEEVGSSTNDDIKNLNRLQLTLQEELMGKKFLLVLDDVWNENYANWKVLSGPFKSGAQGSTVIVTTRNDNVASVMRTVSTHYLDMLSEEDCWSLVKHSFLDGKFDARSELEVIGRQIVKKCEGLPLAVKAIGSILRTKLDVDEWEKILKSELWDSPIDYTNILPSLRLSYKYLPSHLKPCFAYCSIFPKGYAFEKDHLILLWMAEGLLPEPRNRTMKEVGEDYFCILVSRSLFQQSCGNKLGFVMHDLVNNLANFVSGQFNFRQEGNKTRHLSYFRTRFDNFKKFEALYKVKRLRTFLPLEFSIRDNNLTKKVPHDLLPKQRYLRVLSLSHYENVTNLPDSIDKIKQLRYLDLSFTAIRSLPNSLCKLINLQTLKLSCCDKLVGLPRDMRKLINLRHLDITGTRLIMEMPIQMGRLKYLQTLTTFIVSKTSGSCIGELGNLTNLRGKLAILNLQNVVSSTDALDACLKEKKHIKDLVLKWKADTDTDVLESQRTILDCLQPHSNLESLTIKYYSSKSFSDWVGHHSFSNIASLYLYDCKYCCSLPPLGQLPSLKDLSFIQFDEVVKVDREFYGDGSFSIKPFGALKVLRFKQMSKWEEWLSESGDFPLLQELYICDCPKLTRELPIHLPSLIKLEIKECPLLVSSLPRAPSICQLNLTGCNKDLLKDLPTKIQILKVGGFDALDSLAIAMKESSYSLQELEISNCSSLSMGDLPSTLKSLSITNCQTLELPMHQIFSSLKKLRLQNINDSFRSFPLDLFPNLSDIFIFGCEHLETLSDQLGLDLMISHVRIINCHSFVSFPKGGFRASKLTLLWVWSCGRLRSLPDKMHVLHPSLEELQIVDCEELESFPDGGLPCNLKSVSITDCDNLVAGRMGWGLQKLPFLKNLSICGERGDVESFPEVGLLPTNLTALQIKNFPNLKSLDKGLQQLISLEELLMDNCPMLKYMPEEGLPASVSVLRIDDCPLVKRQCQRKKGKEWRKIARVHLKMMDDELIE
ncbi:putative disease resistance RPP13-like protein 1 [Corylus avellana]|uniref:putative disease resistance RPP13-like protein 1 n=1 Tax=Corylus avellana TaxID=13451 RepID=UPI00286D1228|nr:putative disease resistance RPP13-like protein 1 [Corylus avellana]XP_059440898.1 putative disease resistance RPP13-like protein 1 [Corylus avellana]XP_059440899.1 putative disease resistance RPP13-like protein 1 [Corylus avellana]XP_059440900.1 putative disease resistance RPP13-like protein 1 [Corylus avellana]